MGEFCGSQMFYRSVTYRMLEQEATKYWHYSPEGFARPVDIPPEEWDRTQCPAAVPQRDPDGMEPSTECGKNCCMACRSWH